MNKNILKQIKTDYEELEIKPSANLWGEIEDRLESGSDAVQKPLFQWWKYAAAVVLLISLGGLFYFNYEKGSKSKETIVVKKSTENISAPTKNIEQNNFVENRNVEAPKVIVKSKTEVKQIEKLADFHIIKLKETPKATDEISQVNLKIEPIVTTQITTETSKLVVAEKTENKTIKYITANDLIFQRKYSNEMKEGSRKNVKRLGIITINKINISPEVTTAFDSYNNE